MNYIRYHETENLIRKYKDLGAIKQSLSIELDSLSLEDDDDHINGAFFGSGEPGMNVQSNKISDNTYNIANSYRKDIEKDYLNTKREIKNEFLLVDLILEKLDLAFKMIPRMHRDILIYYYCDHLVWDEVLGKLEENKMFISKGQAQRYRKLSILKIRSISMIQISQYEKVIKLIGTER